MATNGNSSYDPDAEELLKDLEDDDDDDEVQAPSAPAPVNQSLVNILASSSKLDAFATIPILPVIPPPTTGELAPKAPKVESKPEPKVESKPEPKVESKPEPKVESKPEPMAENKPEPAPKVEPNKEEPSATDSDDIHTDVLPIIDDPAAVSAADDNDDEDEDDLENEVTTKYDRAAVLAEISTPAPASLSPSPKLASPEEAAAEMNPISQGSPISPIKPFDSKFAEKLKEKAAAEPAPEEPKPEVKPIARFNPQNLPKFGTGMSGLRPIPVEPAAEPAVSKIESHLPEPEPASKPTAEQPKSAEAAKAEQETPKPSADAVTPATPSKPAAEAAEAPKPAAEPTKATDTAKPSAEAAKPSADATKRPPMPPRMPSTQTRALREGEILLTQDALNEMLPGGKQDEGRDLAAFKLNDNNWYAKIFNDDFLRTIPKSSPRQSAREARFIVERLGIESGARVLDLCCGHGRHTIELALKGYDMVGLDLSMTMLKKALADAQSRGQAIKFVHGDMRKLTFNAIFDAIYNVDTSFGYFDELSNFKVLQGIFKALKLGGVFLIETINRDFIINDLPLRLWWKGTECMLLEEIDLDQLTGYLTVQRSFVFDNPQRAPWEQKIQIRLYSTTEMRSLLMRAGFKVVEMSGDYTIPGAHFGATSPRNIFVAEKPVK